MESCALFSSRTITEHLIRGALAFGAVAVAIRYEQLIWPLFIFLPAAFLLWRGCPACWAMGFYQTIQNKFDRTTPPPTDWMTHMCRFARRKISGTSSR